MRKQSLAVTDTLDVYLYGRHVATIKRVRNVLRLSYLPDYVAADGAIPISGALPVVADAADGELVARFLENLLPDREDVLKRWASAAHLNGTSPFDLLSVYGADVAGALEFYPAGTNPRTEAALTPISDAKIAARIRQIRKNDAVWFADRAAVEGFSLGGAQGKFALARIDGSWYEPTGEAPSTHIFKPGITEIPGSDLTEHITMQLAHVVGLGAASTQVLEFEGEHVLVVERFDRLTTDGRIQRIHQEDLAQATGTPATKKYEKDGGPSYLDIFAVFERDLTSEEANRAKERFARCLVFSWVIGHNDGHAKNYSITSLPSYSRLSPFYDLNTFLPFALLATQHPTSPKPYESITLAFQVNGKRTLGEFDAASIERLERDAGLSSGALSSFALVLAHGLQPIVNDAISQLPEHLQVHDALQQLPFATHAWSKRVREVLGVS